MPLTWNPGQSADTATGLFGGPTMIAYSTLGTNDMDRSIAFYDAVFGALGATRELTTATWTRYGRAGERAKVCLTAPFDRQRATFGNGTMLAFEALDHAAVDAFHAAALAQGGSDEGPPACVRARITLPMRAIPMATSSARSRRSRSAQDAFWTTARKASP